jgi:hypothetical protein
MTLRTLSSKPMRTDSRWLEYRLHAMQDELQEGDA